MNTLALKRWVLKIRSFISAQNKVLLLSMLSLGVIVVLLAVFGVAHHDSVVRIVHRKGAAHTQQGAKRSSATQRKDGNDQTSGQESSNSEHDASSKTSQANTKQKAGQSTQGQLSSTVSAIPLTISPSSIVLPDNGASIVEGWIAAADGSALAQPQFPSVNGLIIGTYDSAPPSFPGGRYTQKRWSFFVKSVGTNAGDQTVTITADGRAANLHIKWAPAPSFYAVKGSLARTGQADTTYTYTANFAIIPNNPYFGNPRITVRLEASGPCLNAGYTTTATYNGQNNYSVQCTVKRIPPYVPGSGYPPPMPMDALFKVDVEGQLASGAYIQGPPTIEYILAAGYDR